MSKKMITTSDTRIAMGFLYKRSHQIFVARHGFGRVDWVHGHEKITVDESIPAAAIPRMIRERENYVRIENSWRTQREYDLMWLEAHRIGVPTDEHWPERNKHMVAKYPDGLTLADLVRELGFDQPPADWRPTRGAKWNALRQLGAWLYESSEASSLIKMYPG